MRVQRLTKLKIFVFFRGNEIWCSSQSRENIFAFSMQKRAESYHYRCGPSKKFHGWCSIDVNIYVSAIDQIPKHAKKIMMKFYIFICCK